MTCTLHSLTGKLSAALPYVWDLVSPIASNQWIVLKSWQVISNEDIFFFHGRILRGNVKFEVSVFNTLGITWETLSLWQKNTAVIVDKELENLWKDATVFLWVFKPMLNTLFHPWVWIGHRDLHLIHRAQQWWWSTVPEISSQKAWHVLWVDYWVLPDEEGSGKKLRAVSGH